MKGIDLFFYRIDVLKRIYFYLSIPVFVVCWFFPVGYFAIFVFAPISVAGIILGFVKLPMPKEQDIVKQIYDIHNEYIERLRRDNYNIDGYYDTLQGSSSEKGFLSRRIGSKTVYPVCRTIAVCKQNGNLEFFVKDSPIKEGRRSWERRSTLTKPVNVDIKLIKSGFLLTFIIDGQSISIITGDRHRIKEFLLKYKDYFLCDDTI